MVVSSACGCRRFPLLSPSAERRDGNEKLSRARSSGARATNAATVLIALRDSGNNSSKRNDDGGDDEDSLKSKLKFISNGVIKKFRI